MRPAVRLCVMPCAGIKGVHSRAHPNQKAAKAEAAARGLAALRAHHG